MRAADMHAVCAAPERLIVRTARNAAGDTRTADAAEFGIKAAPGKPTGRNGVCTRIGIAKGFLAGSANSYNVSIAAHIHVVNAIFSTAIEVLHGLPSHKYNYSSIDIFYQGAI